MPTNIHNRYGSSRLANIKVERNIPVPPIRSSRSVLLNTLLNLAVGESIFVPFQQLPRKNMFAAACYAGRISKNKFTGRTTVRRNKLGVRVWRYK